MVKDQSQQIERLMSKDKEKSQQIERLISKDKEQLKQIGRLSEKIERLEFMDKVTPFEWEIPKYALHANIFFPEKSVVSKPFYLFAQGYKYLLTIDSSQWRSDVRLYIKVVPGEFDELLSWPCKEKVRVTLVNQDLPLDVNKNISEVIDFGKKTLLSATT